MWPQNDDPSADIDRPQRGEHATPENFRLWPPRTLSVEQLQ
jgi:hypothetical protein